MVFGTNEIVGKKFFKNAPINSLFVTSIFYTLQGEGPYSGHPCVFVRLTKCNLSCNFCDTFFDQGQWMTYEEIVKECKKAILDFYTSRYMEAPDWVGSVWMWPIGLVITGGEPLLQDNLVEFLFSESTYRFSWKQIESNGTVELSDMSLPLDVTLVCSPKCLEKEGMPVRYLAPTNTILKRADYLKFVMSSDPNSPYSEIPNWAFDWKVRERQKGITGIYVSPMNIYNQLPQKAKLLRAEKDGDKITLQERSTIDEVISFWEPGLLNMEANKKNHEYAARYCLQHNLRFNIQTHLLASLA